MIEQTRSPLATRPPPPPERPPPLPETPFVGLVPFEVGDAPFFFGRERERRLIAANLMASRLTLLYGPSGVGKSSVLRAGVEYDLRERARRDLARGILPEWVPVVFSSWKDDPIVSLRAGIASALVTAFGELAPEPPPDARLDELLAGWIERLDALAGPEEDDRRLRLLIVLDQFEEYFLYHGDEDGEGTLAVDLPRAVNREGLRANFAISIREDAYAQLDRFKGRIPNLFESYVRIRQLDRKAAERAVTLPIGVYNDRLPANEKRFEIQPELVSAVLDEVKTGTVVLGQAGGGSVGESVETGIEAPFLQLVMRRLWHDARSRGDRELSLARLRELGGAASIVGAHLYEAMEELDSTEEDIAARVFRQLVTPSGTKIAHTLADLADFAGVGREELKPMLQKLAGTRILRPVDPPPGSTEPRFEIFHDVLAAAVLDWRDEHVRRQEEAERQRRRRVRTRILAALGTILLLGSVAFAGVAAWALMERNNAESAADEATSLSFAVMSNEVRNSQLDVALLLGLEAYRTSARPEARNSAMAALAMARSSRVSAIVRGNATTVQSVAFSADGETLAFGGDDRTVRLWDLAAGKLSEPLQGHTDRVLDVAFSPEDGTLASVGADGAVRLWDVQARKPAGRPLRGHAGGFVSTVAFSPDGKTLASGGEGGTLQLWDLRATTPVGRPLAGHAGTVESVAFSPDGTVLASAGADRSIRLWDVRGRKPLGLLAGHARRVESVAFSPDGTMLASAGADGMVGLWDVRRRKALVLVDGGPDVVSSVAFDPRGGTLAFAGGGGIVRLWDVRRRKLLPQPLLGHTDSVSIVAYSPDGATLASAGTDGTVRLWDVRGQQQAGLPLRGHTGAAWSVIFSPSGKALASAGADGTVRLWDVRRRAPIGRPLREGVGSVYAIAFSPDGNVIASAGDDGTVRLWNVRTRRLGRALPGVKGSLYSVAFSPDGLLLAAAGAEGTVRLWEMRARKFGAPLRGGGGAVFSVAFSPDGATLASAGEDGIVRLWDVQARKQLGRPLRGHTAFVSNIAFGPDGRTLASASGDGSVRLWDVPGRRQLGRPMRDDAGLVASVAFGQDGETLASAHADQAVRLWDVHGRKQLGEPLVGHRGGVQSVTFSPDGRSIASAGEDGNVRLWREILWSGTAGLQRRVCGIVVGNLTRTEWREIIPEQDYRPICAP